MKTEDELVELSRIKFPIGKGKFAEARMGFRAGYKQCEQEQLILHNVISSALPKFKYLLEKGSFFHSAIELDYDMDGEEYEKFIKKLVKDVEKHLI